MNFQQKLIASFLVIFAVFAAGIVIFEQRQARRYKTEALEERLDAYVDQIAKSLPRDGTQVCPDSLPLSLMPPQLRLTLVDRSGLVVYDNAFGDPATMENHATRPEIADAIAKGKGTFIRRSATVNQPYLYYSKDTGQSLIARVALPYDIHVRSFLKPDNAFLYFVIALFVAGVIFIYYVSNYFGRSVRHLRNFSASLNGDTPSPLPHLPNDELGEVAARLADDFNRIRQHKKQIAGEREKLLLHIQTSAEGVCFFNPDRTVAFYNGLFLQYFTSITTHTIGVGDKMPEDGNFAQISEFLDHSGEDNYYETHIVAGGKNFMLRLNIFGDRSFEVILTDVTAHENNRRLKQEMTGNIAHELRTPVTSIRGFLEILLDNKLDEARSRDYLQRAYLQTKTLSALIADMGLLTRIDERQDAFQFSDVDIHSLLERLRADISAALEEKNISFIADIPPGLTVRGNETLLYSVFRNLTDNVINYGGEGVDILIKVTDAKDGMAGFSFADNGRGIEDERHLARLFERFYRINEGRTRDTGGSGLGLSIVKNAVRLHGGEISVRAVKPHGLEFIFQIPR